MNMNLTIRFLALALGLIASSAEASIRLNNNAADYEFQMVDAFPLFRGGYWLPDSTDTNPILFEAFCDFMGSKLQANSLGDNSTIIDSEDRGPFYGAFTPGEFLTYQWRIDMFTAQIVPISRTGSRVGIGTRRLGFHLQTKGYGELEVRIRGYDQSTMQWSPWLSATGVSTNLADGSAPFFGIETVHGLSTLGLVEVIAGHTDDKGTFVQDTFAYSAPRYSKYETVPEPAALLALGGGLAWLASWRRRK
jgi:hypothetical protein